MAEQPFDPNTVSSMAEAVAKRTGVPTLVPTMYLPGWIPGLVVSHGWRPITLNGTNATRILTRQLGVGRHWDGCEMLNLYRVPGTVPETVVRSNADRTLRDCDVRDIQVSKVDIPRRYGVMATRATGTVHIGTRAVRGRYNYFAVNTSAGAALIEQVILVAAEVFPDLAGEVEELTNALHRSLLASIDRATEPHANRNSGAPVAASATERSDLNMIDQGEQ